MYLLKVSLLNWVYEKIIMVNIIEYDMSNFFDKWSDDIIMLMCGLKWIMCRSFIVVVKIVELKWNFLCGFS